MTEVFKHVRINSKLEAHIFPMQRVLFNYIRN